MFYSAEKNTFYPAALKNDYEREGTWPEDAIKVTNKEWQAYGQTQPPEDMKRGSDESGRPVWVPNPPLQLKTLAELKRSEINAARDAAFAEGLPRDIAGEPDFVQTRPQDQINLLGLRAKAEAAIDKGITDPVLKFRGQNNVTRYLTPEEMYKLTNDALAYIEGIYDHSWELKDLINVYQTQEIYNQLLNLTWNE